MLLRTRSSRPFSAPRRALLVVMLAMLVAMLILRALDVAGFNGTAHTDMDWNGDGEVTWSEIVQGFYAVSVRETREGARVCRHYAFLRRPDDAIRVDCRVQISVEHQPDAVQKSYRNSTP